MSEATDHLAQMAADIVEERKRLASKLDGKDIAEIEIEVKRDAEENGYDLAANPYKGSGYPYAALLYTQECWKAKGWV